MVVISYKSRELADCCTKLEHAQQSLGLEDAQALIELIADAEALENSQALIDFYSAEILSVLSISIQFSANRKALLEPVGKKIPQTADGGAAWDQIRRLKLVEIKEV